MHKICIQPGDLRCALPQPALGKVPFWFTPATSLLLLAATPPLSRSLWPLLTEEQMTHLCLFGSFHQCALSAQCLKYLAFGLAKHSADAGSLDL